MGTFADEVDPLSMLKADPSQSDDEALQGAIDDAGWQVQAVNWVYEQVTGENLIESLISPIVGDFSKIEQNAAAWTEVGDALSAVRQNLNGGMSELRESWEGTGATAFETMLVTTWTVALEADALVAGLVSKGFTKAADMSRRMTDKALELIQKLVDRLIETAATGWIPVAGWANAVRQVERCIDIVMTIIEMYETITRMYDSVVALVTSVQEAGTSLSKIKDVRSLGDAVNVGLDAKDSVADVQQKATDVRDAGSGVSSTFGGGESTGAGSETSGSSTGSSGYQRLSSGTL